MVRDEDDGSALHERPSETVVEQVVGRVRVDGTEHVVQEDDARSAVDSSGERDTGLLTSGQV